jgi:hypothetical protein
MSVSVLKVKEGGIWSEVYGTAKHTHTVSDITDLPFHSGDEIATQEYVHSYVEEYIRSALEGDY